MEYFAGLDMSLRSCAVCAVDGKAMGLNEQDLPCESGKMAMYLSAHPFPSARTGFNPGAGRRHLFYGVRADVAMSCVWRRDRYVPRCRRCATRRIAPTPTALPKSCGQFGSGPSEHAQGLAEHD